MSVEWPSRSNRAHSGIVILRPKQAKMGKDQEQEKCEMAKNEDQKRKQNTKKILYQDYKEQQTANMTIDLDQKTGEIAKDQKGLGLIVEKTNSKTMN